MLDVVERVLWLLVGTPAVSVTVRAIDPELPLLVVLARLEVHAGNLVVVDLLGTLADVRREPDHVKYVLVVDGKQVVGDENRDRRVVHERFPEELRAGPRAKHVGLDVVIVETDDFLGFPAGLQVELVEDCSVVPVDVPKSDERDDRADDESEHSEENRHIEDVADETSENSYTRNSDLEIL